MTVLNLTWFRTTFLACPRQEKDSQREERAFPPFDKWFDMLTILSLSKEGDEGRCDSKPRGLD